MNIDELLLKIDSFNKENKKKSAKQIQIALNDLVNNLDHESFNVYSLVMDFKKGVNLDTGILYENIDKLQTALKKTVDLIDDQDFSVQTITNNKTLKLLVKSLLYLFVFCLVWTIFPIFSMFLLYYFVLKLRKEANEIDNMKKESDKKGKTNPYEKKINLINRTLDNSKILLDARINNENDKSYNYTNDYSFNNGYLEEDNGIKLTLK